MMLLYTGEPLDVPVITLEAYEKWYEIFMVKPDGTVEAVDVRILQEAEEKDSKACWIDHDIHPRMLYRVAEILKGCTHDVAVEVATGRWVIAHWKTDGDFHEPEKPYELYAEKEGCNMSHDYGHFESLGECKEEMDRLVAADQWPGKDWYLVALHSDGREWHRIGGEWKEIE
jgi:hypothetical protein